MRLVSWIVVLGALAWLLVAQLGLRLVERPLPDIPERSVTGAALPAEDGGPGDAVAMLPYARIHPMLQATEVVAGLDRIESVAIVKSRQGVAPEDIVLSLDDGEQVHHFPVGQYGEVTFPRREDWRDAGLVVRTNQPAGSLDLQVTFILRALPGPKVEYAWLWESVSQMDQALAAMDRLNGGPPRKVVGVLFEYAPGQSGVLLAGTGENRAELRSNARGVIRLEMTPEFLDENPTLVFKPMPERMLPLLAAAEAGDD